MIRRRIAEIGLQIAAMKARFPQFHYLGAKGILRWQGILQPDTDFPPYLVEIKYRHLYPPKVFIISPEVLENAPHRFPNGSLCLYQPRDKSWTASDLIAHTIVPWTGEWLYFYEVWKYIGRWFGPEAPHEPSKGN